MKNTTLLLLVLSALSCKKNGSDNNLNNSYGTYQGTAHELGNWRFSQPGGTYDTGSVDSFYAATIQVIDYSPDSIRFEFGTQSATFYKDANSNTYCYACDPTRNLSRYRLVTSQDSIYYSFKMFGGNSESYSDRIIEFAGKK